jgi:homoserine O-acetyltransferase
MKRFLVALTLCILWAASLAAQEQKFASLGDFGLQSGEMVRECKLGYRTLGELNAAKSNAVLFPTWFTGTTKDLLGLVGPGKLVDSSKYFLILVDALGDGVSSSPSNSAAQPHMHFPRFTVRDMVESEHQLVTHVLGIEHLRAVMGISMGGMQTFQWIVSYPAFMDKAIPIVGSPRLTSYDLLLWQAELHAIEEDSAWHHGDYSTPPVAAMKTVADIHALALTTPEYRVAGTSRQQFPHYLESTEQSTLQGFDTNNWVRQLQAMMDLDLSAQFGGSMERAAAAVRAQVMVVAATRDHMVNPEPALNFARLLNVPAVELDSDCGHLSPSCEQPSLSAMIARFLATSPLISK